MSGASLMQSLVFSFFQGITEFLPVSSSGHLVLLNIFFPNTFHSMSYDIFLHMATFFAVLVFFYKDILSLVKARRDWILMIFIGSVPAGIVGVFFKDALENLFEGSHLPFLAMAFLITSALVFTAGRRIQSKALTETKITWKIALVIGLFQAFAILPGISRSGATISAALLLGIAPGTAFVFSFLLSLPAVGGAFLLDILQQDGLALDVSTGTLVSSFLLTFITGLFALYILKNAIVKKYYTYFAYYTTALAAIILIKVVS